MEDNKKEKFEKIIKQYTETKEFQLLETLEDKIVYLKKVLFDPNFFTPLLKTDKALSEEQIDYLSKQKGVDNSKSIGESIFLDDNKSEERELESEIIYLKQQINKLSEKNKKLKSKNRKLKKQLKEINNLW